MSVIHILKAMGPRSTLVIRHWCHGGEIKPPGILSSLRTQTGPWSDTFSYVMLMMIMFLLMVKSEAMVELGVCSAITRSRQACAPHCKYGVCAYTPHCIVHIHLCVYTPNYIYTPSWHKHIHTDGTTHTHHRLQLSINCNTHTRTLKYKKLRKIHTYAHSKIK